MAVDTLLINTPTHGRVLVARPIGVSQTTVVACHGYAQSADDLMAELQQVPGSDAHTLCGFAPVFGDLGHEPRFVAPVARQLAALRTRGVQATLEALP